MNCILITTTTILLILPYDLTINDLFCVCSCHIYLISYLSDVVSGGEGERRRQYGNRRITELSLENKNMLPVNNHLLIATIKTKVKYVEDRPSEGQLLIARRGNKNGIYLSSIPLDNVICSQLYMLY